jgi:outer membrane protein OmpA-like peptidoglycan-associated protein
MSNEIEKANVSSKMPLIISVIALIGVVIGMFYMHNSFQKDIAVFKEKAAKYDTIEKDIAALKAQVADKDKQLAAALNLIEQHTKENARLVADNNALRAELNKPVVTPVVAAKPSVPGEETVEKIVVSILFGFNSFEILPDGQKELQKVASFFNKFDSAIVIEGHADSQGDPDYNVWLSKQRADAVKNVLMSISGDKKPCDIIILGVGSSKPISQQNKQNRRVTVTAIQDCKDYIKK